MVQQDSEMAMILGINVDLISMVVYGLGAALAAAAGCLLAPLYLIFPHMGWTPLLVSFAIVILGGMGSIVGTVVGGLLFGLTMLLTSYYIASGMVNVVPFLAIIVVLLIRPRGIFGKAIL
jgi:branched-chain amino acid transport system permease protein